MCGSKKLVAGYVPSRATVLGCSESASLAAMAKNSGSGYPPCRDRSTPRGGPSAASDEVSAPHPITSLAVRASCFSYRELWTEGGRDYRKSRKDDWQQQSLKLNGRAGNSGAHPHVARGVSAVKSQSEGYRAKAKEYARAATTECSANPGRSLSPFKMLAT
jgi:hypothetical protein